MQCLEVKTNAFKKCAVLGVQVDTFIIRILFAKETKIFSKFK